jgi:hypothetical protein
VALPSAGTVTLKRAVPAASLVKGWLFSIISQSPGMGSRTLTVTGSFLAFFSSISKALSWTEPYLPCRPRLL